jgi:hypothetical protein
MGTSALAALADGLGMAGSLVMLVVVVFATALLLCVVFRVLVGSMPSCWHALGVVLLTAAVTMAVSIVARMLLSPDLGNGLALVVALLVGAGWIDYRLPAPDGLRIGYRKAFLVQLIFLGISMVMWISFAAVTMASHIRMPYGFR